MSPIQFIVTSERGPYPVAIGSGLLDDLPAFIAEAAPSRRLVVVSAPPIWRAHGDRLRAICGRTPPVLIADGERAKTLATVARIYDALVQRGADRSATVIAFGGGVVGDVAGFAAATYLRGIRVVQVPTTLLAQVDSAIGGKTGVNLTSGKNLAGSFHSPSLVVCDPTVLTSLPRREFRAGLYEVVKYGVIASAAIFGRVSSELVPIFARDEAVLTPLIAECCRIKADIVMRDEREAGPRRVLNFGHTVGHALESITKYRRFRHGEAVGYGMLAASALAVARGLFAQSDRDAVRALIARLGPLPPVNDLEIHEALGAILHDKKVVDGTLHFVVPTGIGATAIISDVQSKELRAAMKAIGMRR